MLHCGKFYKEKPAVHTDGRSHPLLRSGLLGVVGAGARHIGVGVWQDLPHPSLEALSCAPVAARTGDLASLPFIGVRLSHGASSLVGRENHT